MVADTRKMYEVKLRLRAILSREKEVDDVFSAMAEGGFLQGKDSLTKYLLQRKCPEKAQEIVSLSKEKIMSNPYLRDIKIKSTEVNNMILGKKRKIPAETVGLYMETTRSMETLAQINGYFICDSPLHLPCLISKDTNVCWMSVEPYEIESFRPFIEEADGNVLLCGCGLGYAAYMLSLKEEIHSITIVEMNPDVIQLFKEQILPQFSNKDKIHIVKGEALSYLHLFDLSQFDFINIDVWHDTIDMLPFYLQCLEIEKENPNVRFSYWLEPTLYAYMQKHIMMAIVGQEDTVDLLANQIGQDLVCENAIANYEDVLRLLSLSNLRNAMYQWYVMHQEDFENLKKVSEKQTEKMLSTLSRQLVRGSIC